MKISEEAMGGPLCAPGPIEWLPTNPPRPAPALMTAKEAATYLRLDDEGRDSADAIRSLEYLVTHELIRPCRVGRFNRYARSELDRFILEQTRQYARKSINQESTSDQAAA